MFSPNYNFSFVSSVFCTLTDNLVVQKVFQEKKFQKNYFSWILIFFTFVIPEYPVEYLCQTFRKIDLFESDSLLKKEVLKTILLFCPRSSVPPLIRGPFKNTLHEKCFSLTYFFLKWIFLHYSWKTSLINFTEPFKIRFSWNYFSVTKKFYLENCFYVFIIGILYSAW